MNFELTEEQLAVQQAARDFAQTELLPPVNRAFTINLDDPSTSESNMFVMPGVIFDTTSDTTTS